MYSMNMARHGSEEQKRLYLPNIACGELRLQSMGVIEPTAGKNTTKITMTPKFAGNSGRKRPEAGKS